MAEKPAGRFGTITDIAAWTCVSSAGLLLALGLTSAFAQSGAGFLLAMLFLPFILLLFVLVLAGPGVVLVVGVRKRRLAMIVGPLLSVLIITGYSLASNWFEMRRMSLDVRALDMRSFASASQHHDLVVMEFGRSTGCDDICQQILTQTDYRVGVPGSGRKPVVYRKISASECQTTPPSIQSVHFDGICVALGSGIHAIREDVQKVDDGLLIEIRPSFVEGRGGWDVFAKLPSIEFSGEAFALVERLPGAKDRVLGRWISGEVTAWPFHSGPIGKVFRRRDFYAAALSLSLE